MRGGLSGFYIFIACVLLGTMAIAGVNSVSQMMTESIRSEGRTILGGDIRFETVGQPAGGKEREFIDSLGTVTEGAGIRTMARTADESDQTLIELRALDGAYPLYGALGLSPDMTPQNALAQTDGVYGAVAAPIFFERLGIKVGDRITVGRSEFELRAQITDEPDALSEGFGFAPRLMISMEGLDASGLIRPGSIVEYSYRVRLAGDRTARAVSDIAKADFPDAGWSVRTSDNAAPALSNNIERFSQFLTLVGLTALIVGGVGVANAVRAFIDGKRGVIATLKCVGASSRFVILVYLIQVMLIASAGILIGLVIGAAIPFLAAGALSAILPVAGKAALYPVALLQAAVFGLLVAFAFALAPLGRAGDVPATALFRQLSFDGTAWPRWPYLLGSGAALAILCALAVALADDRRVAGIFLLAVAAAFVVLNLVSRVVQAIARRAPTVRSTPLRLAIGNIHRPGALTPSVVLSLGLGLALLVTLAQIDTNLRREISGNLPDRAPNFFFVDIQASEIEAFRTRLAELAPESDIETVPMLRGRITALNGETPNAENVPPEGRWVLRGDRGLTYAPKLPEGSALTAGEWWPEDYTGEPLVSFSAEEAGELGLKLGDTVSVSVLGRTITAKIANLREVEWESLSINFVMVFSPSAFAGAPHSWLATLAEPGATNEQEGQLLRTITADFPTVTSVRVKDAIELADRLVGQIGTAIRAAAAIALIASVLVLSGALAAGNRARGHDAVVLKTLGATRKTLIGAYSLEYGLIGLSTALFALGFGALASWFVLTRIMSLPSSFVPEIAIATIIAALVTTIGIGLIGTWRVLGQKAAPMLREL
ncbi:ABC transporter permease [Pseudohoeflea suaedae]|uniref:ABC transporter permease n=1 Tax=Pseudohoeflea suaedae TaxID=877384 RepID=A0A4R5PQE8_9HYPH|nr:ABC transporter permease [Pseudohoeflea suaedae]TDH39360.1 ABC transporter permease [Pseudohoeflea suaedae]